MSTHLYALGDADDIRKKMQGYLLSGDLEMAKMFSSNLARSIKEVGSLAEASLNAEVIYSGGDDILLRVEAINFKETEFLGIMRRFEEHTGATISFGVGSGTAEAFLNLARAKGIGPGTLVWDGRGDERDGRFVILRTG